MNKAGDINIGAEIAYMKVYNVARFYPLLLRGMDLSALEHGALMPLLVR